MNWLPKSAALAVAGLLAIALALGGCGSSSDSSSSSSSSSTASTESESSEAETAAAAQILEPYVGQPSAFPVSEDEPLEQKPPADTTFAYLQCATPICGLFAEMLQGATDAMGVQLSITKTGESVSQLQAAMDTIVSQHPDAVILSAVEPTQIAKQLEQLEDEGIPTLANGIVDPDEWGIDVGLNDGEVMHNVISKVMAAWAVEKQGADANVVYYATPELSFGAVEEEAFKETMSELCPDCSVRTVIIPLTEYGEKAPSHVVSDLQANPDTNVAVFGALEAAGGLTPAMRTAGQSVDVVGLGATPSNLQEIKSGGLTASIYPETAVGMWELIDAGARLIAGQALTAAEERGEPPFQLLEASDLSGDLSKGYNAYPEYEERFLKVWNGE